MLDRYYDYSTKSSTRFGCGRSTCQTHKLIPTFLLPSKITAHGSTKNNSQLIELMCDHLLLICCSRQIQYSLIVTGSSMIPRQVQNGLIKERTDLSTTHEEADEIIVPQACQFILDVGIKSICVV